MPILYSIVTVVLFLAAWPVLAMLPKLRAGWGRRLGFYPADVLKDKPAPRIWLHGASAGDLLSLLPIYVELRKRQPRATFIVSTMTNSGAEIAVSRFKSADLITFQPFDLPWVVSRTVRAIKPDVLVLEYTEIWPNLIRAAKRFGAKIVITNGRFSEANLPRYRLLFALIGNVLKHLDLLLMREDVERERALALGAPRDRVLVSGNTKFDALLLSSANGAPDALAEAFKLKDSELLWVAGSTHEGEEGILLDVFKELRSDFPHLRMVIAPRYTERGPRVAALATERGLGVSQRSGKADTSTPVVVLDSIGELMNAYRLATIVFVGGSFTTRGGQNILEPASCGKAVLFGPHMENFHDSVQILVGRGGIQVNDPNHLRSVVHDLLSQPEKLAELGALAKSAISGVRGASERNAEYILKLVEPPSASRKERVA
jgi:3-deoxy-D-manno-octulosonic-acid transferase